MPSTVIANFAYDQASRELLITFVSGIVYRFKNVPPEIYSGLISSREKGIYFNRHIRGKFSFEKQ
jgi:KTSC domain